MAVNPVPANGPTPANPLDIVIGVAEAVAAGGIAYAAAVAAGATQAQGIIAGAIAALTKLAPTTIFGSGVH